MTRIMLLFCFVIQVQLSYSQVIKDFFYIEKNDQSLPVFVRGNLDKKTILLFVQGGPGDNGIDFGRSDYPRWRKTLEQHMAIAYYDQRGLNQKLPEINKGKINFEQYRHDFIRIARYLKEKYDCNIYALGHSSGGWIIMNGLNLYPDQQSTLSGVILANMPLTNDHSPERYHYYRPLYLKNLANELISNGIDTMKWQKAFRWITSIDSITTQEQALQWNEYVNSAFTPTKRRITPGMFFKVMFKKPYTGFSLFYNKDNELVNDLLWESEKSMFSFSEMNPKYPILLLTGRFDDVSPPEEMEVLYQSIDQSQLIILQDASHESFLDQPGLFNIAVINFMLPH